MIGKQYGRLTVLSISHKDINSCAILNTVCSCGKEKTVRANNLKRGLTLSCGCLQKEICSKHNVYDQMIGKTYNRLTILSVAANDKKDTFLNAICSCGKEITVRLSEVTKNRTKSCGCLHKEIMRSRKGSNSPSWKGGVTPINKLLRFNNVYKEWRIKVFLRDNYLCKKCGKGGSLQAHHLNNFSSHPELRYALDNGQTLCLSCHLAFHKLYGNYNNTMHQFYAFLGQ